MHFGCVQDSTVQCPGDYLTQRENDTSLCLPGDLTVHSASSENCELDRDQPRRLLPAVWFCTACELRMVFTFFSVKRKQPY